MMLLKKQVFGYNKSQVDELINEKDNEIKQLNDQIKKLQEDYQQLEHQKSLLQHRVNIQEQTNEEIARLALKEASDNAIMPETYVEEYNALLSYQAKLTEKEEADNASMIMTRNLYVFYT